MGWSIEIEDHGAKYDPDAQEWFCTACVPAAEDDPQRPELDGDPYEIQDQLNGVMEDQMGSTVLYCASCHATIAMVI